MSIEEWTGLVCFVLGACYGLPVGFFLRGVWDEWFDNMWHKMFRTKPCAAEPPERTP